MTPRAVIGGTERDLGSWRPSRRKLQAIRQPAHLVAGRDEHTIAGVPTDYDQGALGSCGPNALAEVYEFHLRAKYSRLFAYYWTRATEGEPDEDSGVTIADLLDVARAMGLPREVLWPYDPRRFATAPPLHVLADAADHRVRDEDLVGDLDHLLYELDHDRPVLFGFGVPASMQDDSGGDTATTGVVRVPSETDPRIGGHAVTAIGFSRPRRMVRATCHYGPRYGDHGCIWLPFEHWSSGNATDMRAIRRIG